MRFTTLAALLLAYSVVAEQVPLQVSSKKSLKGRFLHITDIHPDRHYIKGGDIESACHKKGGKKFGKGRGKRRSLDDNIAEYEEGDERYEEDEDEEWDGISKKKDTAGRWGTALTDCDSPLELVDIVFDWLKKEWADEIDFVVWTGDNARHDRDRLIPRTPKEIFELNRLVSQKMVQTFGKNFPVVPTLGNNDIWPHNVLAPGPNRITEEFLRIWKPWIPEDERHIFERGAHFSREVIPDRLAVISLNTLFWYTSNSAVDGCKRESKEPGALQMDWLEVQLQNFRDRGMQVWLIGHVPPHDGLYYDNCYIRYGDLALRFQDTILGHLYGHQNIDHFFFLDVEELNAKNMHTKSKSFANSTLIEDQESGISYFGPPAGPDYGVTSGKGLDLQKDLLASFQALADPEKFKHKDYSIITVGPSVIPTYLPSVRVYSYNISGVKLDDVLEIDTSQFANVTLEDTFDEAEEEDDLKGGKKKDCKRPENEDKPRCSFKRKPRYSSPDAPSRSNQPLTPLGYTQFYLPDLARQKKKPEWQIEYTTFKPKHLVPSDLLSGSQPPPLPYHLLPAWDPAVVDKLTPEDLENLDNAETIDEPKATFLRELKRITPYHLKDLTINSYVKFARRLLKDKKLWNQFVEYMFVSSGGN